MGKKLKFLTVGLLHKLGANSVCRSLITKNFDFAPTEDDFEYKIADCWEERQAAFKILYESYRAEGFCDEEASNFKVTPYHLLPTTAILVVKFRGEVIGGISFIQDSDFGTPVLNKYPHLRSPEKRIGEIGSLAIAKEHRSKANHVLMPLLKRLWNFIENELNYTHTVIAHDPKWEVFYQQVFQFEKIDAFDDSYESANGAPAVFQILDFAAAGRKLNHYYFDKKKDLFNYLKYFEESLTEDAGSNLNLISPDEMAFYLSNQPDLLKNLTERQKAIFVNIYSSEKYAGLHQFFGTVLFNMPQRRFTRVNSNYACRVKDVSTGHYNLGQVLKVSLNGLQIKSNHNFKVGDLIECSISVHKFRNISIRARVRTNDNGFYGLAITQEATDWYNYFEKVSAHFNDIMAA